MDWHPKDLRWEIGDGRMVEAVLERQVEADAGDLSADWRWEAAVETVAKGGGGRQREG